MRRTRVVPALVAAVLAVGTAVSTVGPSEGATARHVTGATTTAAVTAGTQAPLQRRHTVTTRVVHGGIVTRLRPGSPTGEVKPTVGPESQSLEPKVTNRSLTRRFRQTAAGLVRAGIPAASTPIRGSSRVTSFSGIDHHQQRLEVANGNQWSVEPPDQGLCVGNGYVLEAVNNAVAVYGVRGRRLALRSLNSLFGYPFEVDYAKQMAGPKQTTDPSCLFDPTTRRFFVTVLSFDSDANGNPLPTGTNSIDVAVSHGPSPLGKWTITHIDATDDGSNGTPVHPGCPCIGDYPHIGVDAHGYFVTTNEYPFFTPGFVGAQVYAMSKTQLVSGATSVRVTQIDTSRAAPGGKPGFTLWPAQSPDTRQYDRRAGGTEYLLSTNAAEEVNASSSHRSRRLLTWSVTNTRSLAPGSAPNLGFHVVSSAVGAYAVPPLADQQPGQVPLADCLNRPACSKVVAGQTDPDTESLTQVDAGDSRMQQVSYAHGTLYGAHGTAVDVGSRTRKVVRRVGVAYYLTRPRTAANGNLSTRVFRQARIAAAGNNLLFPALAARPNGSAVLAMTVVGLDHHPSPAYVTVGPRGRHGPVRLVARGAGPEDGFSGYQVFGARPRWGDYGAAAVDESGSVWTASEWIGQTCSFRRYQAKPFGTCGGTRTALANWSTRISRVR